MFGGRKAAKQSEPTTHGWRERDLQRLITSLRGDRPTLRTKITGFRQCISVDGDSYISKLRQLRSDHEMYQQSALLFDEVPGDERQIPMIGQENELVGTFLLNHVRVEGGFGVASNFDSLADYEMGWANITALDDPNGDGMIPLLQFGFTVSTSMEQIVLQDAFRSSVSSNAAFLNLSTRKVDDIDAWVNGFRKDGYSPRLPVKSVFIGAEAGHGPFD